MTKDVSPNDKALLDAINDPQRRADLTLLAIADDLSGLYVSHDAYVRLYVFRVEHAEQEVYGVSSSLNGMTYSAPAGFTREQVQHMLIVNLASSSGEETS